MSRSNEHELTSTSPNNLVVALPKYAQYLYDIVKKRLQQKETDLQQEDTDLQQEEALDQKSRIHKPRIIDFNFLVKVASSWDLEEEKEIDDLYDSTQNFSGSLYGKWINTQKTALHNNKLKDGTSKSSDLTEANTLSILDYLLCRRYEFKQKEEEAVNQLSSLMEVYLRHLYLALKKEGKKPDPHFNPVTSNVVSDYDEKNSDPLTKKYIKISILKQDFNRSTTKKIQLIAFKKAFDNNDLAIKPTLTPLRNSNPWYYHFFCLLLMIKSRFFSSKKTWDYTKSHGSIFCEKAEKILKEVLPPSENKEFSCP